MVQEYVGSFLGAPDPNDTLVSERTGFPPDERLDERVDERWSQFGERGEGVDYCADYVRIAMVDWRQYFFSQTSQ